MSALRLDAVQPPSEASDAPALFEALGQKFKLHGRVIAYINDTLKLSSLEEFYHLVADGAQYEAVLLDKITEKLGFDTWTEPVEDIPNPFQELMDQNEEALLKQNQQALTSDESEASDDAEESSDGSGSA